MIQGREPWANLLPIFELDLSRHNCSTCIAFVLYALYRVTAPYQWPCLFGHILTHSEKSSLLALNTSPLQKNLGMRFNCMTMLPLGASQRPLRDRTP